MGQVAVAPFQALVEASATSPAKHVTATESGSESGQSTFGDHYAAFQEALEQFLSSIPGLPALRIQVGANEGIRLQPADPQAGSPEAHEQLQAVQDLLNADHHLSHLADQLVQSKSAQAWRTGAGFEPAAVEFLLPAAAAA
jgi:hypothetical protein